MPRTRTRPNIPLDVDARIEALVARVEDLEGAGGGVEPWRVEFDALIPATTHTTFNTITYDTAWIKAGYRISSGAQDSLVAWDVGLSAGTWKAQIVTLKAGNLGIYSVQLDAVEKTTIDPYDGSFLRDIHMESGTFAVATSGKYRVALKMAAKNASSSGYYGYFTAFALQRTA